MIQIKGEKKNHKMFALKRIINYSVIISRNSIVVNQFQKRLLYNSLPLFSKQFSPDSSPIKIVSKKKRKISSSSEEDEVIKKEPASPAHKKK